MRGRRLYANIYAFLVGPPGSGKTTAIIEARKILTSVRGIKTSPAKTSPEKFIHMLAESHTQLPPGPGQVIGERTASLTVLLDELSTFIKAKDHDFMTILTDLFDCPPIWVYQTFAREEDRCENVHLNILGGITKKSIAENLGQQAFGMGFTSRIIFVNQEGQIETPLFGLSKEPDNKHLHEAARKIHQIAGEFSLTKEAVDFAEAWYKEGMHPYPEDSRFVEYLPRRAIHWLKLGLIVSASRSGSRVISLEDMQKAKAILLETEKFMPGAVELVGKNPINQAVEDVHRWMLIHYMTNKKRPIPEGQIINKLAQSVPLQYQKQALESLISTGRIQQASSGFQMAAPNRQFIPIPLS